MGERNGWSAQEESICLHPCEVNERTHKGDVSELLRQRTDGNNLV